MRCLTLVLILGSMLSPAFAEEQGKKKNKDDRVRASEPTVVTVYGQQQKVEPQQRSVGGKVVHGIRSGATGAARGIASFTGWLLNTNDDVPRERDRQQKDPNAARER